MSSSFIFNKNQIEDILSVLPETNSAVKEIALLNRKKIQNILLKQLIEINDKGVLKKEPTQQDIDIIKSKIFKRCERALIHPGENVGLLASESIGEPISQQNLDSFHVSGAGGDVSSLIKIFTEILNISKNRKEPKVTIHLKNKENYNEIDMYNIAKAFIKVPITKLLLGGNFSSSIEFKKSTEKKPSFYSPFEKILKLTDEKKYNNFLKYVKNLNVNSEFIRLYLDVNKLFYYRITTKDIGDEIEKIGGILTIFSPTKTGIIDIYISEINEKQNKKFRMNVENEDVLNVSKNKKSQEEFFKTNILTDENISSLYLQVTFLSSLYSNKIYLKSSTIYKSFNKILKDQNSVIYGYPKNIIEFKDFSIKSYDCNKFFKHEIYDQLNERFILFLDMKFISYVANVDIREAEEYLISLNLPYNFIFNDRFSSEKDVVYCYSTKKDKSPLTLINNETNSIRYYFIFSLYENSAQNSEVKNTLSVSLINTTKLSSTYEKDVLTTSNSNTLNILYVLRNLKKFIDIRYLTTNNFHEVFDNYGIESCRQFIFKELRDEFDNLNNQINNVHIKLVVDVMTNYGLLTGFTHSSTSLKNFGAYFNSSFEQALRSFKEAALSGKEEYINPASTCVLFGKKCNFGTGAFKAINKFSLENNEDEATSISEETIPDNKGGSKENLDSLIDF